MVLATRSAGKLRELLPLLAEAGLRAVSLSDVGLEELAEEDSLEEFDTFEENALAKARYFSERSGGRVVLADDSGLEVDALDGAPGVRSKRWGGFEALDGAALDAANNTHLLRSLEIASLSGRSERSARYVCAAACVWPGGSLVFRGATSGEILDHPEGSGGFGYDPLFRSDELAKTFGSASRDEKASVSHRGRAFGALVVAMGAENSLRTKLICPVDPEGMRG